VDLPESVGSVTAPSVIVIDRVLLPAGEAGSWLDRLRAEYAPGACQRGMRLADTCWCYVGPDAIEVTVRWELPDVASFWAMRHTARTDRSLAAWWAETDAVAVERHRTVCSSP
jgi:hypothetical protein